MSLRLTIGLPTFNRLASLKATLSPTITAIVAVDPEIELLVVDNCSDDGTHEWLQHLSRTTPSLRVVRNHVNVGMEGNIAATLLHAKGDYVWLLSDHMLVDSEGLEWLLAFLRSGAPFDIAYGRIAQYASVLPEIGKATAYASLSPIAQSRLPVVMSNVSAFLIRRELLVFSFRSIFRFSGFSYPHLGALTQIDGNTRVVETPILTAFAPHAGRGRRVSYDMFRSRFIGLPRALQELARLNSYMPDARRALSLFRGSFAEEVALGLFFKDRPPFEAGDLIECCWHYDGACRYIALAALVAMLCPSAIRRPAGKRLISLFSPKRFTRMNEVYARRYADEFIRE